MYETEATGLASPWEVTREIAHTIFKFPLSFMICALHYSVRHRERIIILCDRYFLAFFFRVIKRTSRTINVPCK